jgi:hypothetical protein
MSDLKSGKEPLPPEVKEEALVGPEAQPPTVGPPPTQEEAQPPTAGPPPAQDAAVGPPPDDGEADDEDEGDYDEDDPNDEDEGTPDFTDRDRQKAKAGTTPESTTPAARSHKPVPTTPTTPTTPTVAGVVPVVGTPFKRDGKATLAENFLATGAALAKAEPRLIVIDGALVLLEKGRPRLIESATKLSPLLIDTLNLGLPRSLVSDMLGSRLFLGNFLQVDDIVNSPVVLADGAPCKPGYNAGGILYTGGPVQIGTGIETINKLLSVVEFDSNASRTNVVGAALTVLFPHHWYGGKPLFAVTANDSHSGKGTLCEFIIGNTAKIDIPFQCEQWPMEDKLHKSLLERPDARIIYLDNVRLTRRNRFIKSQFFESLITNKEISLASAKLRRALRGPNKYVVLLNTNEGSLVSDLLNRDCPIHIHCTDDLQKRIAKAKAKLGGLDVKTEWLPANMQSLQAELWYMIDRWLREGKPLDDKVKHPYSPWAKTIGGILMVNGFADFLANYEANKIAADPIREAIGQLAFYANCDCRRRGMEALPTKDLGELVFDRGLNQVLLERATRQNCEVEIGKVLSLRDGHTFTAATATEVITYRLTKQQRRWMERDIPRWRYAFSEVKREERTDQHGIALEEPGLPSPVQKNGIPLDAALEPYQPKTVQQVLEGGQRP